jgi:hypothetical protein
MNNALDQQSCHFLAFPVFYNLFSAFGLLPGIEGVSVNNDPGFVSLGIPFGFLVMIDEPPIRIV